MREQWKDVVGYEGLYQVSTRGRVRSVDRVVKDRFIGSERTRLVKGRVLSQCETDRYPFVQLSRGGTSSIGRVHRLVCEAFHGPPADGSMHAAHIDGNPSNNQPSNLRWATPAENYQDKVEHGTACIGESHGRSKLTENCVHIIRAMARSGEYTHQKMASMFGVSRSHIGDVVSGKRWKHLPGDNQ